MDSPERFYTSIHEDQRLLKAHGFDRWPDNEELARQLFRIEEKIDLLSRINGIQFERDVRGRLRAHRSKEVR